MLSDLLGWFVDLIANAFYGVFDYIDSLVVNPPSYMDDFCDRLAVWREHFQVVLDWLPVTQIGIAAGLVVSGWAIGLSIKLARIAASFATFGGGSAA